ncbi:MAG: hypothetical protein IJ730_07160 [Alphaproteobacteria bacterium]|nr:hypothetical protein [Alphaproteobacteria bacterium]
MSVVKSSHIYRIANGIKTAVQERKAQRQAQSIPTLSDPSNAPYMQQGTFGGGMGNFNGGSYGGIGTGGGISAGMGYSSMGSMGGFSGDLQNSGIPRATITGVSAMTGNRRRPLVAADLLNRRI